MPFNEIASELCSSQRQVGEVRPLKAPRSDFAEAEIHG